MWNGPSLSISLTIWHNKGLSLLPVLIPIRTINELCYKYNGIVHFSGSSYKKKKNILNIPILYCGWVDWLDQKHDDTRFKVPVWASKKH